MIDLKVGDICRLDNGWLFIVASVESLYPGYPPNQVNGTISHGFNSIKGYMKLANGSVYDATTYIYISKYTQNKAKVDISNDIFVCDCGGMKTYNTLDAHCHSSWCSSIRRGEHG